MYDLHKTTYHSLIKDYTNYLSLFRSVTVMLAGKPFYQDMTGNRVAATPLELGVELIGQIYLLCLDKGTSVDLSNLYFMPLKTVYVEPPFHYIKVLFIHFT